MARFAEGEAITNYGPQLWKLRKFFEMMGMKVNLLPVSV
jgi:hypothetical protein